MATTTYVENGLNTPNGSHLEFSYSFPVLKTEDVKVALNGVTQATTKYVVSNTSNPTRITFNNTSIDSDLQESTGAPKTGVVVRVYRDTDIDSAKAVYAAGSSIRATDLNNNQDQVLYALQEEQNQKGIFESISLDDDVKIKLGNSDDFTIEYDGSNQAEITSATSIVYDAANAHIFVDGSTNLADFSTLGAAFKINVLPHTDNAYDLGASSNEWKDLYVDGTGYIDTISADTATINGNLIVTGTISDSGGNLELADDVNISGHIRLPDDKKLYLGNGDDASIDWDTDGWTDRLEIRSAGNTYYYVGSGDSHAFFVDSALPFGVDGTKLDVRVDVKPYPSNAIDLGKSDGQWKDLYVDGTGYIDTVSADVVNSTTATITNGTITNGTIATADINGGAIDGTTIGASTASTGAFTTLTTSSNATISGHATATSLQVNQTVASHLIPSAHANYSLGATNVRWGNAYVNNLYSNGSTLHHDTTIGQSSGTTLTLNSEVGSNIIPTGTRDIGASDAKWNKVWTTDLDVTNGQLNTLGGMQSGTASKLADSTALTADIADLNQIDGLTKQTTLSDSDASFPTSGAVVDYVASQLDPVGGLEVIATDAVFPNTQPASGVVVSIADAGGLVVNGSGVSTTGRTVGGSTVTINNINSQFNSTTIDNGVAMMVSSTGSGQVYNYHKATLREQDILSISSDIQSFGNRYRVGSSNPSSDNDAGDLFFNTATDKLLVRNAANNSWDEAQSVGNFYISTLSPAFNGVLTDFTITNAPTYASQVLLIINGVLQKPNAGTSAPADGFALDGSTVKLGGAPATGSTYSAVVIGSTVNIGTPSDNTVSAAVLQSGSVITAKLAADAVDGTKIADDAVGAEHIEVLDAALQFGDSVKAQFGTGNYLELYSDGTDSYISHTSGDLYLYGVGTSDDIYVWSKDDIYLSPQDGESGVKVIGNGAVQLYYDGGSAHFQTESYGNQAFGEFFIGDGDGTDASNHIRIGNGGDLKIYHDGTDTYFKNHTTGSVYHRARVNWQVSVNATDGGADDAIKALQNGAVELYWDHAKKFETRSGGVAALGDIHCDSDTAKIKAGLGGDLTMYHNGSHSFIDNLTGTLYLRTPANLSFMTNSNEDAIQCIQDGAVKLYWNNSKRLETMDEGVNIIDNTDSAVELRLTADSATRGHVYADSNNYHGFLNNSGNWSFRLESNGDYHFYGSSGSDRDLKDNITTVTGTSLDKITKLVPKTYNWKATADGKTPTDKTFTGFIAQEVKEHLPVLVTGTDGQKDMSVDYFGILAHAVKAITELSAEVETLKTKVAALEAK